MTDLQANIGRNVYEVQNELEGFKISFTIFYSHKIALRSRIKKQKEKSNVTKLFDLMDLFLSEGCSNSLLTKKNSHLTVSNVEKRRKKMHLTFILILVVYSIKNIVDGHVILITSPFYGHMIPLLDFAKRLSEHHYVTYIASASKLGTLKQHASVDENNNSRLKFIGLNDGNDDDYEVSSYNSFKYRKYHLSNSKGKKYSYKCSNSNDTTTNARTTSKITLFRIEHIHVYQYDHYRSVCPSACLGIT